MAIDILSKPNSIPIIVGDAGDMADVVGVGIGSGRAHLVMLNGGKGQQRVPLSAEAGRNFATADHALLVELAKDGHVTAAYRMPMNGGENDFQALDPLEIEDVLTLWEPAEKKRAG